MLIHRCVRSLSSALMAVVMIAAGGVAQSPAATLTGIVRDTTGAPVARTRLMNSGFLAVSDSGGRFSFASLPAGASTLAVRRLGFAPLDIAVQLVGGRRDSVNLVMTMLPAK